MLKGEKYSHYINLAIQQICEQVADNESNLFIAALYCLFTGKYSSY